MCETHTHTHTHFLSRPLSVKTNRPCPGWPRVRRQRTTRPFILLELCFFFLCIVANAAHTAAKGWVVFTLLRHTQLLLCSLSLSCVCFPPNTHTLSLSLSCVCFTPPTHTHTHSLCFVLLCLLLHRADCGWEGCKGEAGSKPATKSRHGCGLCQGRGSTTA